MENVKISNTMSTNDRVKKKMSDNGVMIIGESIWIGDKEELIMVTCRKIHIYIHLLCKLLYMCMIIAVLHVTI